MDVRTQSMDIRPGSQAPIPDWPTVDWDRGLSLPPWLPSELNHPAKSLILTLTTHPVGRYAAYKVGTTSSATGRALRRRPWQALTLRSSHT